MGGRSTLAWLGFLVFGGVLAFFYYGHFSKQRPHTVLFLYASGLAYHDVVHGLFLQTVKKHADSDLTTRIFAVPDATNKLSAATICERVLNTPTDCIVVVGKTLAQILVNLAKKRGVHTPIVLLGADRPVELGLVDSLDHPGGTVTGVFTAFPDESQQAALLYAACPQVKSVLIPIYVVADSDQAVASRAQVLKGYLESKGVSVTLAQLDTFTEAVRRVEGLLPGYDIIMTLENDGLNDSQIVGFAKLAYKYQNGLFAGVLEAISEGALFAYAVEPRYAVEAAFDLMKQIVYQHVHPSKLPIVRHTSSREFIINQKRATELGLTIDVNAVIEKINADPVLECVRGRVRVV
ncbi:MAG: putative tryptophan/tyrosine transport system substrate-binding protein [Candidatus Dependentiae bacterium]|nr:putative tryptophan/tyrosine transport system substrate-binding protein [Candidatus Dependentiae bacterium]